MSARIVRPASCRPFGRFGFPDLDNERFGALGEGRSWLSFGRFFLEAFKHRKPVFLPPDWFAARGGGGFRHWYEQDSGPPRLRKSPKLEQDFPALAFLNGTYLRNRDTRITTDRINSAKLRVVVLGSCL